MLQAIKSRIPRGYRDLSSVLAGNLARNFMRGLFKLLTAFLLTPQAFGVVRAVWSVFRLTASLAELGIDHASVTLGAAALGRGDREHEHRLQRAVLGLKLAMATAVLIVGNLLAGTVALRVLGDAGLEGYVRLAFFSVSSQLVWRWIANYLTTHQQFRRLALYLVSVPCAMLAIGLLLAFLGRFDTTNCLLIYLLTPALAALGWWFVLRRELPSRPLIDLRLAGKLTRFGRWVYATNLASANRNSLNQLLLKNPRFSGSVAAGELNAGLYSFGSDLAAEITVISNSLVSVMIPKAAARRDGAALRRFVARSYLHLAWLIVPLMSLVFVARPLLLLLGELRPSFLAYLPALEPFVILYMGSLFAVASIPMQAAIYAMRMPHLETWIELAGAVLLVATAIWLIPSYGAVGGAWAVVIQRAFSFAILIGLGTRRLLAFERIEE